MKVTIERMKRPDGSMASVNINADHTWIATVMGPHGDAEQDAAGWFPTTEQMEFNANLFRDALIKANGWEADNP